MGDRQVQEVEHPVMKPNATLPNPTIRGRNCVEISNANTTYRQHQRSPCFLDITYHIFFKRSNLASVRATMGFSLSRLTTRVSLHGVEFKKEMEKLTFLAGIETIHEPPCSEVAVIITAHPCCSNGHQGVGGFKK